MRGQCRAVLIVEDDAELRSLMAALLEDGQRDIIECESAEAALATMLIRGREFAIIFADVRLPGVMNGVDLAWEVKMRWSLCRTSGGAFVIRIPTRACGPNAPRSPHSLSDRSAEP